jgi:hypothetical protein
VQRSIVAALCVSAALILAACGAGSASPPTVPATFTITTPTPTSTVPTPVSRSYLGPNGLPIETGRFLAPATTTAPGPIEKGIQCQSLAQLAYTAYIHLQVYVEGRSRALPGGIGLVGERPRITRNGGLLFSAKTCMYWLHTLASDGLIEIQSPVPLHYTLGDFFRIWNQPLSGNRVATAAGHVTAIVDGSRWNRDPSAIPLNEHTEIELAVGTPVPAQQQTNWLGTGF